LNGLRIKQQLFRQFTEQYKWNYILDNNADEDHKDEDDGKDKEDNSDVDNEDNPTSSPTTSNKKRKYNAVMGMITPGDDDMMGNSNMAKSYPYLSRALGGEDGFDPTNPSVKRSMCGLLTELNKLLSSEYQLDVNGISNNKISYVRVPRTHSDCSFLNSKEWVDTAIQIAGSKCGGTFESAKRITNHIIRYCRDSFLAACEAQ